MQEPVFLLDSNVLIALADTAHVHHSAAEHWFCSTDAAFATCPITQGALLRLLLRFQAVADIVAVAQVLAGFTRHPRHRFWADTLDYAQVRWTGVIGHRQVTDAYLAALARHHQGKLVSFDQGLVALHQDIAIAISV